MSFTTEFQVAWVDTDALSVVHFSNYFRYFERAEQEFFASCGHPQGDIMEKMRIAFPRVSASCDYRNPLRFGDKVRVSLALSSIGKSSVRIDFEIVNAGNNALAASGHVTVVCVSIDSWKSVELPDEVRLIFERLGR